MRRPVLMLLLFYCAASRAQLPALRLSGQISPVLSKVIVDFPNDFEHIRGEVLSTGPEVSTYAALLTIREMEPGIVEQYGDERDHLYSWSNILLETDDFEEAKKKFHSYYTDIKRTTAVIHNFSVRLVSDYTEPDESKKFTHIIFPLETIEESLKDVVVELSMQYELSDWKITVSLYRLKGEQYAKFSDDHDQ